MNLTKPSYCTIPAVRENKNSYFFVSHCNIRINLCLNSDVDSGIIKFV